MPPCSCNGCESKHEEQNLLILRTAGAAGQCANNVEQAPTSSHRKQHRATNGDCTNGALTVCYCSFHSIIYKLKEETAAALGPLAPLLAAGNQKVDKPISDFKAKSIVLRGGPNAAASLSSMFGATTAGRKSK